MSLTRFATMTTDKGNINIEINIAGEFIRLVVPYDKQESVRKCESAVNSLYSEWRNRFPRKTPMEILAMIAYQYASFFNDLEQKYQQLSEELADISESIGRDNAEGAKP